jgi:hypothetical protein
LIQCGIDRFTATLIRHFSDVVPYMCGQAIDRSEHDVLDEVGAVEVREIAARSPADAIRVR